jgi:hypothetical protein
MLIKYVALTMSFLQEQKENQTIGNSKFNLVVHANVLA